MHLSGIVAYYLLGASIGLNVEFLGYFLIVPLIFLVGFSPISYAGCGVREVGAVWLLGLIGMPEENALTLSVALGFMLILLGVPGLIWLVIGRRFSVSY